MDRRAIMTTLAGGVVAVEYAGRTNAAPAADGELHVASADAVFSNEVYNARHNGVDNPNIAVLKELHDGGVELRVCGQGLMGKKVDPSQLLPAVRADLRAMATMVNPRSPGVRPRGLTECC
jgi:hypothetical protein